MDEYTKICMKEFTSRSNLEHVILMANASQDVRCDAAAELAALRERAEKAEAELAKMLLADFADVYSEKKLKADKIAEKFWDTWEDVEKAALKGDA